MIKFFFIWIAAAIIISCCKKLLTFLNLFLLKNKIKNNPLIGVRQPDGSYDYIEKRYTVSYRITDAHQGSKSVEWLSLKRRLTRFEEKTLKTKKKLKAFFLYQRWLSLLRPSFIIFFTALLIILYLGIREESFRHAEHFKFLLAKITGLSPESIRYEEGGWFRFLGKKKSVNQETEPVSISFNPIIALFSQDAANVGFWSKKLNKYISYPVDVNERGDIWLGKGSGQFHGNIKANKVVWDKPKNAGLGKEVRGEHIAVKDGKLQISDE